MSIQKHFRKHSHISRRRRKLFWMKIKKSCFVMFHHFLQISSVQVTVDLETQMFPDHFETTILHHVCWTSREIAWLFHVNVHFSHASTWRRRPTVNQAATGRARRAGVFQIVLQLKSKCNDLSTKFWISLFSIYVRSIFHWYQPSSSHILLWRLSFAEIENLASITLGKHLLRQF